VKLSGQWSKQNLRVIDRYKKQVSLTLKNAHLSDISYAFTRGVRKENIEQLSTNHYIHNHQNVILQEATGTSKSYLANALVNHAIESGFTGKYYRIPELLNDVHLAEFNSNLDKLMKKLMKFNVLVIDDFLLTSTKEQEQKYLMEIFELRSREKSLILCSQMSFAEWHKKLGGGAINDAILDRACSKAYQLFLSGGSLRKFSSGAQCSASAGNIKCDLSGIVNRVFMVTLQRRKQLSDSFSNTAATDVACWSFSVSKIQRT